MEAAAKKSQTIDGTKCSGEKEKKMKDLAIFFSITQWIPRFGGAGAELRLFEMICFTL